MRRPVILSLALATMLAGAFSSAAVAQTTTVDDVAAELRSDPVYVDPEAEQAIDAEAADRLRDQIASSGTPVFIAIVPEAAVAGDADAAPRTIGEAVGLAGTYAVVAGDSFRAASSLLAPGQAGALATASFQAEREQGVEAVLSDFVDRVSVAAPSTGGAGGANGGGASGEDDAGGGWLPWLLIPAAAGGGFWFWRRSKRRRADEAAREAERQMLRAELTVLGDDVLSLEQDVVLHAEAQEDYEAAVSRFKVAQAVLESPDHRYDLVRVRRVVEEGTYAMARARARLDGRPVPPPPPSLQQRGAHGEPPLVLDEEQRPVYAGGGYGPFYGGGWYMGGNGMLTGLLLGSMIGGWGSPVMIEGGGGDGGGDWGGGDFGGGFGGGDFGGGDFGGGFGDFGGGDF